MLRERIMSFLNKLLTGDISLLHENGIEGSEVRKLQNLLAKFIMNQIKLKSLKK